MPYNSWVPYLAQPTKVGVSEYEYMVIPNIAVSVIISVSVAHTISIHFGLIYVIRISGST